ncbi:hypothetical protein RAS1_33860 [Phycisphaerae bacterium RAS1]|nr:hypothetical protein RAS1_33860 [Phycisphaerae bacterium RAS1]
MAPRDAGCRTVGANASQVSRADAATRAAPERPFSERRWRRGVTQNHRGTSCSRPQRPAGKPPAAPDFPARPASAFDISRRARENLEIMLHPRPASIAVVLLLVAAQPARPHDGPASASAPSACSCDQARLEHHWCFKCGVGYLAGVRISAREVYDALDPHGHTIDTTSLACDGCRAALKTDGFCDACRRGFVGARLYFSPLAHGLARGVVRAPEQIACRACRRHAQRSGWCESCGCGMVGNVELRDRAVFDRTARAFELLLTGLKLSERCPTCAAALALNSSCPKCRVAYRDGQRVEIKPR